MATWIRVFVATILGFTISAHAFELIETPSNITVRSLTADEATDGLEFKRSRGIWRVEPKEGRIDVAVTRDQACAHPAPEIRATYVKGGGSEWQSLSSLCPKDGPVKFVFISDTQQYDNEHQKSAAVIDMLLDQHPDMRFVVNAGDIVDKGGSKKMWATYRQVASRYTSRLPIIPVIGNHEFYADEKLENRNRIYDTEETKRRYYTIDYGPFVLIVLDSNVDQMGPWEIAIQDQWLESELLKYSGLKAMIPVYHHAAYASGLVNHLIYQFNVKHIRSNWLPLFKQYGVKVVLSGHEHLYERLVIDGIPHVIAGPAGGMLGQRWPFGHRKYSVLRRPGVRTISLLTVEPTGSVHVQTWDNTHVELIDDVFIP